MYLQILVPTCKKNKEQILALCEHLNVQSDCIIANQNGLNESYSFIYKGFNINVICSNTVGVSVNRNILLKALSQEFGLMLDDDCVLSDNYPQTISDFFEKTNCDFALFNAIFVDGSSNKLFHNKGTKKVKKFCEISYAGGPGLCFKKSALDKTEILYDEKIGVPNYIEAGEDTVFHFNLLKKSKNFYRAQDVIFTIYDNNFDSSYYKGVDKQYIETRGYITKCIHPFAFSIYKIKHCLRFKKENPKLKIFEILKYFSNGRKLYKKGCKQ